MLFQRTILVAIAACGGVAAADGGASIQPAPGFEPPRTATGPARPMPSAMAGRPSQAFEVESLVFTGDAASHAAWAMLAGQGFHLVGSSIQDGKPILFLERMAMSLGGKDVRLPAAIEANPELAAQTRAKLLAIAAERQQAMRPPMQPQPLPPAPVAPTLVPAPGK